MIRSRFALALAASIALHLAAVTSPGWGLPGEDDARTQPRLEAQLAPPPAPAAAAAAKEPGSAAAATRKAKPRAKLKPAVAPKELAQAHLPLPVSDDATPAASSPGEDADALAAFGHENQVPEEPPLARALPALPAAQLTGARLPERGRIRYSVTLGQHHLIVGRAVQTWQQDGEHYLLKSVTETIGLIGLFKRAKLVQVSEGMVTASGLIPEEFRSTRNDAAEPSESASFDWDGARIALRSRGRDWEAPLAPGTQDVLSAVFQLSLAPPSGASRDFMVATGKSYNRLIFDVAGEVWLPTGVGEVRTLHLRTRGGEGEQTIELWLALDYRNLPVRLRFTDKKGEVADLIAAEVEFEGVKLAELPPQQ